MVIGLACKMFNQWVLDESPAVPQFTFLKVGMLVSIAWTGGATGLVFWVLDQYNMLRVEMEHEFKVSLKCSSS